MRLQIIAIVLFFGLSGCQDKNNASPQSFVMVFVSGLDASKDGTVVEYYPSLNLPYEKDIGGQKIAEKAFVQYLEKNSDLGGRHLWSKVLESKQTYYIQKSDVCVVYVFKNKKTIRYYCPK